MFDGNQVDLWGGEKSIGCDSSSTLNRDLLYKPCSYSLNFRKDTILIENNESLIFDPDIFL